MQQLLKFNEDKTYIIVTGTDSEEEKVLVDFKLKTMQNRNKLRKNLGVIRNIDLKLSFHLSTTSNTNKLWQLR